MIGFYWMMIVVAVAAPASQAMIGTLTYPCDGKHSERQQGMVIPFLFSRPSEGIFRTSILLVQHSQPPSESGQRKKGRLDPREVFANQIGSSSTINNIAFDIMIQPYAYTAWTSHPQLAPVVPKRLAISSQQ